METGLRLIADLPDTLDRKQQELELQITLTGAFADPRDRLVCDSELEETVRESTTGQPKPIGRRGARMADTVGAAQD